MIVNESSESLLILKTRSHLKYNNWMHQKGINPALSNDEILEKWRNMTKDDIDVDGRMNIEKLVLGLEKLDGVTHLGKPLAWLDEPDTMIIVASVET